MDFHLPDFTAADAKRLLKTLTQGTALQMEQFFEQGPGYVGHMNRWTGNYQRMDRPTRCDDAGYAAGRLWLSYLATGDERFRKWATHIVDGTATAVQKSAGRVHVGADLIYGLCWGAAITGSASWARAVTDAAHGIIATGWSEKARTFVTYLPTGDIVPMEGMAWHVPLIWASKSDPTFIQRFTQLMDRSLELGFVRDDGSCYQIVELDADHRFKCFASYQGYADDSTWARGQAWGILSYLSAWEATKQKRFLDTAQRMANWWLDHTTDTEPVPFYDFDDPDHHMIPRDSCAATMAADAFLRLARIVPTPETQTRYIRAADIILAELARNYVSPGGVVLHGSSGNVKTPTIFGRAVSRLPPDRAPNHRTHRFPMEEVMPYGNFFIVSALYRRLYDDWSPIDMAPLVS